MSHKVKLADDLELSGVVTGLWQIADMEREGRRLDLDALADAMLTYVEAGLTSFDMADHYGSAEDIAGLFRSKHGAHCAQMFTKWVPQPGPVTRAAVRAAVERSLKRMNTDRLELLQFHTWSYAHPSWLECLFFLQELQVEGLIGHLGLTNFNAAHLNIVVQSGIRVVSNQVSFSLIDLRAARAMSQLCFQYGIKLLAYGTLAGGLLSERWLGVEPPPSDAGTWSQMKYGRFIRAAGGWTPFQRLLQTLHELARQHGVSVANLASGYILEQPAVGAVIIGARLGETQHIADSLKLLDFKLDAKSRARIEEALRELGPIPGDCGDEYRKPPFLTASGDLNHHLESLAKPFESVTRADGVSMVLSGTAWEEIAGFCRAVRMGDRVIVSGTTATHRDRVIGGGDAAAQAHFVVDKLEAALVSLGARLEDVVRTRVYIRNIDDWEAVARVHGERFGDIRPANTLVQAGLVGEEYLVEMEAEAWIR